MSKRGEESEGRDRGKGRGRRRGEAEGLREGKHQVRGGEKKASCLHRTGYGPLEISLSIAFQLFRGGYGGGVWEAVK